MKCVITGFERGLGKELYDHFIDKGWEVIGLNKVTINTRVEFIALSARNYL